MFGNFIFFIIALIIYATYQPVATPRFALGTTLVLFSLLLAIYTISIRKYFERITANIRAGAPADKMTHRFDVGLKKFAVWALIVFAFELYGLNLPGFLNTFDLFNTLPTLEALVFLSLFIIQMIIIWHAAYTPRDLLFPGRMTQKAYITGQVSLNLPILLPWIALSALMDMISVLPFDTPKQFLLTPLGQTLYFLGFLLLTAILAPAMIRIFWRCKPLADNPDHRRIAALSDRAGVKFAAILQWPLFGGRMLTAGVMGLVSRFRYLLVTKALLQLLTPEEVDSVIAHEIGHVKKKHLYFYLFFLGGYMLLSFSILDLIIYVIVYSRPVTVIMETIGQDRTGATTLLFSLTSIVLFLVYFRYIFGFFMRNFERQADTYVYTLFNSAEPLISTLRKIAYLSGQPADKPNWHHFSIGQRIGYLEKCETDRRWVGRQDRKIKKWLTIFTVAMVMVGIIGYQVNFGKMGQRLNQHYFESVLKKEVEKNPSRPELYRALADIYYNLKRYSEAIKHYNVALDLSPADPEVLNSLAWLYATCDNQGLRSPRLALALAKQAVAISPRAHILDTLAESYYINGKLENAIESARMALVVATENRSYFKDQLSRFRKAADKRNGL
jgi:Zn-dependent protease with chaperone function